MKNEFLPYDRALKLKQLGFDEPCFGYHYTLNGKDWKFADNHKYHEIDDQLVIGANFTLLAPLFQQAFRWFREKHGIMHRLTSYAFGYQIHLDNTADFDFEFVDRRYDSGIDYKTYEEAELACLDKMIEIVESKQNK
jgi:hypothetical protein